MFKEKKIAKEEIFHAVRKDTGFKNWYASGATHI